MPRPPPRSTLFPYTTLFRSAPGAIPAHGQAAQVKPRRIGREFLDRKSTRLNSSHLVISYAVFCLKKKKVFMIHTLSTLPQPPVCSCRLPSDSSVSPQSLACT